MSNSIRATATGLVAALALGVAACGGNDDVAVVDTGLVGTPAPATVDQPAAAATALRVTDVTLGRAMRGDTAVVDDIDDFAPNDTIHAVVRHEGAAQNTTITARWTFQDGQVVDERTETITAAGTGPEYTHFMITKGSAWPAGDYRLHILVNGQEVETEDFEVKQ